jgi:RNA polymerase sigma-70 factor (ECF subfamily)
MQGDETSFLAQLRGGDQAAYEKLVREHSGRMLAVAKRILRSDDDARDAVQDAFLQAFRGIERFAGDARLGTWLHRIVVNASLMKLRARRRKPEASIDELLPRFQEDGHRVDPGPAWRTLEADPAEARQLRERVRAGIDRLPEIYRTALLLRDIEGLDTAETAAALGITPETLKMRLHRGRQALRSLLNPFYTEQNT